MVRTHGERVFNSLDRDLTFSEFYKEKLDGVSDTVALSRADDELMLYQKGIEYGNFFFNLRQAEYSKLKDWFFSRFMRILHDRIDAETGEQDSLKDEKLKLNFTKFRFVINRLYENKYVSHDYVSVANFNPVILFLKKILRGKLNRDPQSIENIGKLFEPGSAMYFLELYAQLFNTELLQKIQDLVEGMDEVEIRKIIRYPMVLLEPWDHQQHAFDAWKSEGCNGILEMATATGKTLVGLMGIEHFAREKKQGNIRILAHSRAILNQWRREAINKLGLIANINTDYSIPISINGLHISFNTIQSIYKNPKEYPSDFIIVDEVHHSASIKFRNALRMDECQWKMGLSATVEGEMRRNILKAHLGRVVYEFSLKEALASKVLPKFDWKLHMVNLSIEEEQEFNTISKKIRELFTKVSRDYGTIMNISNDRDYVIETLYDYIRLIERARYKVITLPDNWKTLQYLLYQRRWIMHRSHPKLDHAINLARSICNEKKVILFAMDIQTCDEIYRRLKHDIDNIFIVHSKIDEDPNKVILQFKEVDTGLLIGAKMLDEGIDIPDAEIGINVSSSKTKLQLIQRIGRILRMREGKKPIFHQYISIPAPEGYVNKSDDITLLDNISWAQDIALGMGLKTEIDAGNAILEDVRSNAEHTVRRRYSDHSDIGYLPGYGTLKLQSILDQFTEEAMITIEGILSNMDRDHRISDNEWSNIVREAFQKKDEEQLNIPGYWWILLLGDRDPQLILDIISRR